MDGWNTSFFCFFIGMAYFQGLCLLILEGRRCGDGKLQTTSKKTWKFALVNDDQVCPGSSVGYVCLQVVKNSPVMITILTKASVFYHFRTRFLWKEVAVLLELCVMFTPVVSLRCHSAIVSGLKLIAIRSTAIA